MKQARGEARQSGAESASPNTFASSPSMTIKETRARVSSTLKGCSMTTEDGRVGKADQALVASDEARSDLHPSGFDPSRIGRWSSIAEDGPPMPEVFVLCWDGRTTFVDWCGSKADFGRGVTHWIPYELPPGAESEMHDGRLAFASVDTLPKGEDREDGLRAEHG